MSLPSRRLPPSLDRAVPVKRKEENIQIVRRLTRSENQSSERGSDGSLDHCASSPAGAAEEFFGRHPAANSLARQLASSSSATAIRPTPGTDPPANPRAAPASPRAVAAIASHRRIFSTTIWLSLRKSTANWYGNLRDCCLDETAIWSANAADRLDLSVLVIPARAAQPQLSATLKEPPPRWRIGRPRCWPGRPGPTSLLTRMFVWSSLRIGCSFAIHPWQNFANLVGGNGGGNRNGTTPAYYRKTRTDGCVMADLNSSHR